MKDNRLRNRSVPGTSRPRTAKRTDRAAARADNAFGNLVARRSPGRGQLTVKAIQSFQEFLDMEGQWDQLLQASDCDSVFMSHSWYRCWWEAFNNGNQLCILVAHSDGQVVGIAPLYLRKSRFRGLPVRRLSFMVNGMSPDADIIAAALQREVLDAMLRFLASRQDLWSVVSLERLREDSFTWRELPAAVERAGLLRIVREDKVVPFVPIVGDWRDFLHQRSRSFRKAINKRLNRIQRHCESVRVVRLDNADQIARGLTDVLDISSRSWKASRGRALADHPAQVLFYNRLSKVLAERGWVNLWMLYFDDRPVAFEYHLNYRGVTSPIRADFDEQYASLSPGAHLEYEMLRQLFGDHQRTVREYNTCADGYAYELKWTDLVRPHHRMHVFGRGGYGRCLHALGAIRRPHAERTERSVRDL